MGVHSGKIPTIPGAAAKVLNETQHGLKIVTILFLNQVLGGRLNSKPDVPSGLAVRAAVLQP